MSSLTIVWERKQDAGAIRYECCRCGVHMLIPKPLPPMYCDGCGAQTFKPV